FTSKACEPLQPVRLSEEFIILEESIKSPQLQVIFPPQVAALATPASKSNINIEKLIDTNNLFITALF
ncbi:hypothetical protein KY325_03715, partial [Candidatus Woesearchaeota archaeon]|nr:hypothetical protein [Candidatus Woesearchaeota archaeon]